MTEDRMWTFNDEDRCIQLWVICDENGIDGLVEAHVLHDDSDDDEVSEEKAYLLPHEVIDELGLDPDESDIMEFLYEVVELRENSYLSRIKGAAD